MTGKSLEIVCSKCGADTLLKREPVYEGFKKTGEKLACASCGHQFAGEEEVPYKTMKKPAIFGEDDRGKQVRVFGEDEKGKNCRYCAHYVVNPFTQRCGLTQKIVQATDFCGKFEKKEEEKEEEQSPDTDKH